MRSSWPTRQEADPVCGARQLKRAIQQKLENGLAQRILGEFGLWDTVRVETADSLVSVPRRQGIEIAKAC